jgi:hypothetical protein
MDRLSTVKQISELVKKYNDLELMKEIVTLQTEVFDLQRENLRLETELSNLQRSLQVGKAMVMRPPFGYYYRDGDEIPFCPGCWENDTKQIHLPDAEPWSGGVRRDCRVCGYTYWEKPSESGDAPVRRRRW